MVEAVRTLLNDDDLEIGEATASSRDRENPHCFVTFEQDPAVGLTRIAGLEIDCVVADSDTPEINGLDLLRQGRETPVLPVFVVTGHGPRTGAAEARPLGGAAVH